MKYNLRANRLDLSSDITRNILRIRGEEFFLEGFEKEGVLARGGNSTIFRAVHPEGNASYVVKFFRFLRENELREPQRRLQRFEREVEALRRAQESDFCDCVVRIIDDGVLQLEAEGGKPRSLRYYVMAEAEADLSGYLRKNELSLPQKVFLCKELLRILKGLHDIDIYHRDIKPENIFVTEDRPMFGDLGLINYRNQDSDMDRFDEKIGPIGFLSPEATNKCLGIRNRSTFTFECEIDEKSDIFQLGQVFWLVLQDEVPTGQLLAEDAKFTLRGFFENVIIPMLQYPKRRRAPLDAISDALAPVLQELALV